MKTKVGKTDTILLLTRNRGLFRRESGALKACGYEVIHAPSKKELISLLEKGKGDCVFIDVGEQVKVSNVRTATELITTRQIPVVLLVDTLAAAGPPEDDDTAFLIRTVRGSSPETLCAVIRIAGRMLVHERKLKESEARYRSIVEHINDAYYIHDLKGKIIDCNKTASLMIGYTRKELVGAPFSMIGSPRDMAAMKERVEQLLEKGWIVFDGEQIHKNGTPVAVTVSARLVSVEGGGLVQSIVRDITERKRTENALAESERYQRLIIENATFGARFYELTPAGQLVFSGANPTADRLLGVKHAPLVGKTLEEAFPGFAGTEIPGKYIEIAQKGGYFDWDLVDYREEEIRIAFEVHAFQSSPGKVAVFFSDISERKRAEGALAKSEGRFRLFMENFPGLAYIKDGQMRNVFANSGFLKYLGINPDQIIGKTNKEVFPADFAAKITADDREVLKTGESTITEEEFAGRVWETCKFTISQRGGAALLGGFTIDITERKKAEESLLNSERKFVTIFALSPEPSAISEIETGVFIDVNRAFVNWSGYERDELIGHSAVELHIWTDPEDRRRVIGLLTPGKPIEGEHVKFRIKNGEVRDVLFSSTIVSIEGKACFLSIDHDITERMRAEEERERLSAELIQAQKMESVGRLAGGMAHDFNNLLTVILGSCELLGIENFTHDSVALSCLEQIRRAGERARDLTRQLLAFSRKQILEMKTVSLNAIVTGFRMILQRLLGEDIVVKTALAPDLGFVTADASQIEQVIMNLAVNSRDSMQGGGTLSIATANVDSDTGVIHPHGELIPGAYVVLSVSDTGSGMDGETLSHLFEPFFTTKETGKGTGLGLAMVYGIVRQHNGHILYSSELGRGTTFSIYLPRVAQGEEEPPPAGQAGNRLHGTETVLVVEDEAMIRNIIATTLVEYGYRVIVTETVHDALREAEALERIDILLADLVMPEMSGKGVFQKIAAFHPETDVLYMSGYSDDVVSSHGILEEGIQFIQKPFLPSQLAAKLRAVLDKSAGAG